MAWMWASFAVARIDLSRLVEPSVVYAAPLRRPVPLSSAPQHVIAAVLATEDRRFFDHAGVDPRSAVRAAWVNAKRGRVVEGGSTITQQLVKSLDSGAGGPWISKLRVA